MKNDIKLFIIVCLTILATGCAVNYNLEFKNDVLEENIDVVLDGEDYNEDNKEKLIYSLENEAFAISKQRIQEKYNINYKEEEDKYIGKLNFSYTMDNFADANLINQCYDSFSFVKLEDGYSLTTSDIFKCVVFSYLPVEKYNITITTNHLVTSHNADEVNENKYTWFIVSNGDIQMKKPIKITFSDKTQNDQIKENLREKTNIILISVLGVLLVLIVVIYVVYHIKSKRNS